MMAGAAGSTVEQGLGARDQGGGAAAGAGPQSVLQAGQVQTGVQAMGSDGPISLSCYHLHLLVANCFL